jgi:hypothetical protein
MLKPCGNGRKSGEPVIPDWGRGDVTQYISQLSAPVSDVGHHYSFHDQATRSLTSYSTTTTIIPCCKFSTCYVASTRGHLVYSTHDRIHKNS